MTATLTDAPAAPAAADRPARRHRPLLWLLLAGTAVLYLWNLTASGWANSYYAAATQAATESWQAWLFGSLDAGNSITVDKPPASLWLSGLFARVFGFSSWTVLAPQALAGVGAVGLLYLTVKRVSGAGAGLLAGAALALTPVATLMFRYNLPDALLTLLLVAAAYAVTVAIERAGWRWLALAGALVGLAFLTKMLQAFVVLPAFVAAYLVAAPAPLPRRLAHVGVAAVATVLSAGWYVALVELWPPSSRPYISGSSNDSLLELTLGYNGLGRIFGGGGGAGGSGPGNVAFGGEAGLGRMFGPAFGTEVSWLLPAAIIAVLAGLWFTRHAPRTDRTRAALLLWGGWLAVTALVFSLMTGIVHPYYAVALAPAIAAPVGIACAALWRGRTHRPALLTLAAMVATTSVWTFILLARHDSWLPWLRWTILACGVLVATALATGVTTRLVAASAVAVALAGSSVFTVATAAESHTGSIPLSGPPSTTGGTFMAAPETTSDDVAALLRDTDTTWAAATVNGTYAANLSLASGRPVMAIGGWNGSDPSPTLAEFQHEVRTGHITYYITQGATPPNANNDIATWVKATYPATTLNGQTLYTLQP